MQAIWESTLTITNWSADKEDKTIFKKTSEDPEDVFWYGTLHLHITGK